MSDVRKRCPECEGRGEVEYEVAIRMSFSQPHGFLDTRWCECERCMGSGEIVVEVDDDDQE